MPSKFYKLNVKIISKVIDDVDVYLKLGRSINSEINL
mgnify:CR=1 FL=1|jgi:hypothetical protein